MITTLKNNNNLLRKHIPIFKRRSEFRTIRRVYKQRLNSPIERKELTKEERAEIRAKALAEIRKENRIRWIKRGVFTILVGFSGYTIYKNSQLKSTYHYDHYIIDTKDLEPSKSLTNNEEYNINMSTGIEYLQENKWFFAAGYFEAALRNKPGDKEAEYNLAISYCLLCYNKKKACNKAEQLLSELIKSHPENLRYKTLQHRYLIEKNK